MHKISFIVLFPLLLQLFPLTGAENFLNYPNGAAGLDVDTQARFFAASVEFNSVNAIGWVPLLAYAAAAPRPAVHDPRNYWNAVNENERDAIRYIILTLGNEPLYKLYNYEGAMNQAAERFKTVHPLNVWKEIFTSKDTISALVNLRSRKLVWKPFMKGMADSLQEAHDGHNIHDEHIADFAAKIGMAKEAEIGGIKKHLKGQDWTGFVQQLIDNAKKSSKDDRYNI